MQDAIFQFQSGTIKGIQNGTCLGVRHKFQFQSGTIKGARIQEIRHGKPNFNSNLVRLKEKIFSWTHLEKDISIPIWYD